MKQFEDMTQATEAGLPQEIASAINLMAHPLAGVAAAGALGFGVVSHAFGLWLGAMAGAAEMSQRMLDGAAPEPVRKPVAAKAAAKLRLVEKTAEPVAKRASVKAGATGATDDLKVIAGIGPKLEKVLNGLGIRFYADIVALDAARIADIEEKLGFPGRIGRDDWVGQAMALSGRR